MNDFSQIFLSGVSVGCISALVALGFVIIAKVTGVYNFAQGEYVMVGGMVAAWSLGHGYSWPIACTLATLAVGLLAAIQERLTVAPARSRISSLGLVVASLGFAVVVRGLALVVFGSDPRRAQEFLPGVITVLGARLSHQVLFVWLVTAVALAMTVALFKLTQVGRAMRAIAIDPSSARQLGISVGPLSLYAFILSGALTGLVGAVTVPLTLVSWNSGITVGLSGFVAAALAQFKHSVRAVVAGLGLGVVESLAAGYVSSTYRQLFVYGVLLVYLLVRDLTSSDGVVVRLVRRRNNVAGRHVAAPVARPTSMLTTSLKARAHPTFAAWRLTSGLRGLVPLLLVLVVGVIPLLFTNPSAKNAAIGAVLLAIGATGLSLVMGLAGQLSLGQGAFYLVGGYSSAILTVTHHWPAPLALVAGVGLATLSGYAVGWLTLRLEGFNLAIATLAVDLGLLVIVTEAEHLTGGQLGTYGIPPLHFGSLDLSNPNTFYAFGLAALATCLLIGGRLWTSNLGLYLRAIGSDPKGVTAAGLDPFRLKLKVFVISSAMAGLAGSLWAFYFQFADPTSWNITLTIDLVTFVIVGGLTSIYGGVFGVVSVQLLRYLLDRGSTNAGAQNVEYILSGLLLIVFSLVFRNGLTSSLQWLWGLLRPGVKRQADEVVSVPATRDSSLTEPTSHTQNASSILLTVSGLEKRFGAVAAVANFDLTLSAGEITALIGSNGAGKSTVINLLSGELVPSAGTIILLGRTIAGRRPDEIVRLGLTRTFQTPRLFTGLSTRETVTLACSRRRDRDAVDLAQHYLEFVGLGDYALVPPAHLPAGHQRMLEVARALAAEPVVILMDEPAAGMDESETEALKQVISDIADLGTAVLLVEHALNLVMSVADRVVVLEQGRKIADAMPEDVAQDTRVIKAYLGVAP